MEKLLDTVHRCDGSVSRVIFPSYYPHGLTLAFQEYKGVKAFRGLSDNIVSVIWSI